MTPTAGECTTPESVLPAKYVGGASLRTFGPFWQFSSANNSVARDMRERCSNHRFFWARVASIMARKQPEDPQMPADAAEVTERWPNYQEGDFVITDYVFRTGETLPELKLHYRTLGTARRNTAGKIINGVLLLQGNTGTGANWLRSSLADELFAPGEPLDAAEYFIIMPDAIGRGGSSKPSDAQGKISPLPLPRHGRIWLSADH
jgi:hypothetical protein